MKRLARIALALLAGAGSLTAVAGLLHTPVARPLLNALHGAPGCPVSLDQAEPEAIEVARVAALRRRAGTTAPASNAALGWELGKTRRSELLPQLDRSRCEAARSGTVLRCRDVPEPGADLYLQFDARDRLVAVDLLRAPTSSQAALRSLELREQDLTARVGRPSARSGRRETRTLSGAFRRVASEFRYRDYVATLSAMNYGRRGVRLREQYQWAPGS